MPPKETWGPESSHEGVKLPLASGFTEPHPTPQRREEVAENQGLCEPLRILRMSHFPGGGWEGLVGEEDPWKLIEKQRQLQTEEPGPGCDPPSTQGQPSQCPSLSRKGQCPSCFLSWRFWLGICFSSTWHRLA